jgi:hypothetical protein
MMPLHPSLAPKIDPLIRRLASGFEGERLATLLALERVLIAGGSSFHDLADALTRPPVVRRSAPRPSPGRATHGDLLAMASELDGNADLSPWETDFVANMRRILRNGHPPSEKQTRTLERIWQRVRGVET